jgi:ADP-ribose pyrophosphatase YjhB (NUDIX family)
VRAQVVLLRQGSILLARHELGDHVYWVLPGGEIEANETPEEAAVREMLEETGLRVEVERLLFVDGPRDDPGIVIRQPRYTYLGRLMDGDLESRRGDECHAVKGQLVGAAWMPFDHPGFDDSTRDTLRLVQKALDMTD